MRLEEFIKYLEGNFNNEEQFKKLKEQNIKYPFCEHKNTTCNNKIKNLPNNFNGIFMVEESYYTDGDTKRTSPHLFLFEEIDNKIKLTSYEIPNGYDKNTFTYNDLKEVDFNDLKESAKFTPALYTYENGTYKGGSVSMFSPVLKFTLYEEFTKDYLSVSESMEVNGKRTFGYDDPIIYKRIK